jgi:4-amino-4-deoxy-L-arabinose transferase-like glycosyltransferase
MNKEKTILFFILILAFVLRFWKLDTYPALNADEAAIGYNAYSLLQTGKDEHGNPWPIHFQSFNDYKPGLYFYMVLPLVKLLGLNEWSVRAPSAFIGVLTVLELYYLIKELKIANSQKIKILKLEIIASFLMTINPWHIHFSRGGWEVNVATFFITLGILFFLKALKNPKYFAFCVLSFALSLYTYHAARVIVPILGVGFAVIYFKTLIKNLKWVIISLTFGIILIAPLVRDVFGPAASSRASGVSIFADLGTISKLNEQRGEHSNPNGVISKLFHNKATNYSLIFLNNWSKHFWGEFLFLSGDEIQRNKVPETGQLYLFEIVTVAIGCYMLIKKFDKSWAVTIFWLITAPSAAAITFQSPHALRAHNMLIPLTIISAYGLVSIINSLKSKINSKFLLATCYLMMASVIAWSLSRYLHEYYQHMSKEYPFSSQYGIKELVAYIKENGSNYEKIFVTNKYDQPYILFLFYLRYPPSIFQKNHVLSKRDKFNFSTVEHFDKYYFRDINFEYIKNHNPKSLIIGTADEIPKEANITANIYGSNNILYFKVAEN